MRHKLRTEIDIEAPPEMVWSVLTDLACYGERNPFIVSSEGHVEVGERFTNRLQPPGVFDGRHWFELEPTATGGTHLVHSEQLNGVLVRIMRKQLDTKTHEGLVAMNTALKARSEASAHGES